MSHREATEISAEPGRVANSLSGSVLFLKKVVKRGLFFFYSFFSAIFVKEADIESAM